MQQPDRFLPCNIAALDDGNLVTLASDKAELLNTFFADVGKDLAQSFQEQILDQDNSYRYIPKVTAPISGQLNIDETYQVKTLNASKSTGNDNVAARELKLAGSAVIPSLRQLFNKCLENRKFPSQWKKSIFKKGKTIMKTNYRPISLLSVPGKLFGGQIC